MDEKGNLTVIGNDENGTSDYQRIIVQQFSRGKKVLEKNLELKKDFEAIKDLPIFQDRAVRLAGSIGEGDFFTIESDGKRKPVYPYHWKGQELLFSVRRKDAEEVYEMLGWANRVYVAGTTDFIAKSQFQKRLFIEEMDRQGNTIRSTTFGTGQNDSFGAFTVGPKGENYLVDNEKGGYLIVKYDSNGRMLWKKTYINWVNKLLNLLVVMLGFAVLCLAIYSIYIIHGLVHKNRKEG